jgi:hypothetical protein
MSNIGTKTESIQKSSFFKSKIFIGIICLLIVGIGGAGYFVKHKEAELKKVEEAKKIEEMERQYKEKLSHAIETIYNSYVDAQPMTKMYSEIWNVTIKGDVYTDRLASYFNVDEGEIVRDLPSSSSRRFGRYFIKEGDFETGLKIIYNIKQKDGTIGNLESGRDGLKNQLVKLNNPSKNYEEIYNKVLDYYSSYEKYMDLAISPSGSYNTYTNSVNSLSSEVESQYNILKISMP